MAWYKCSGGGEGIPLITKSGSIVEYEDAVGGVPVNDLVAQIVAVQSGTGDPSPSNIRPISGFTGVNVTRAGKNLFNKTTLSDNSSWQSIILNVPQNTDFTMSSDISSTAASDLVLHFFKDSAGYLNKVYSGHQSTINSGSDGVVKIQYRRASGTDSFQNYSWQIEVGSSATAYEPYIAPTTYSVTWQTEAGTVYGGSIDLTTGVLTVTHTMCELTGADITTVTTEGGLQRARLTTSGALSSASHALMKCNMYKPQVTAAEDVITWVSAGQKVIWIFDNRFTNLATAQSLLNSNHVTLVYPLATPQRYQLTPKEVETILGINHIVADTGDIAVKFYKPVTNLDTLVEQTKDLAPDLLALASAGNGTSTREAFDMTDETTGTKATRIPDYMFYKNLNVEKINLSTVESVGSNSFYMCPYLKEINLPNATELKSSAFNASSRSLTSPTPMVINLPSCTNIADSALREMGYAGTPCTITLTACETLQGNAIRGASARYFVIDTLDLPAVKTIGQECLNYHQFTNVIIGTSCTSIASKPFNYCTITNLTVKATTPPTLNANGLGCTPTHIYVPTDSVATYKAASNWSTYASIIEAIPT